MNPEHYRGAPCSSPKRIIYSLPIPSSQALVQAIGDLRGPFALITTPMSGKQRPILNMSLVLPGWRHDRQAQKEGHSWATLPAPKPMIITTLISDNLDPYLASCSGTIAISLEPVPGQADEAAASRSRKETLVLNWQDPFSRP